MRPSVSDFSRLRTSAGISIDAFAASSGFSRRTVYRWERGEAPPRKAAVRMLDTLIREHRQAVAPASTKAFRFIDLFAGIGGLRSGFDEEGECVFTSEWDKYSQATYLANYDCGHEVAGDITKVPVESIPAHDLLLAGFPCQPFSIAAWALHYDGHHEISASCSSARSVSVCRDRCQCAVMGASGRHSTSRELVPGHRHCAGSHIRRHVTHVQR